MKAFHTPATGFFALGPRPDHRAPRGYPVTPRLVEALQLLWILISSAFAISLGLGVQLRLLRWVRPSDWHRVSALDRKTQKKKAAVTVGGLCRRDRRTGSITGLLGQQAPKTTRTNECSRAISNGSAIDRNHRTAVRCRINRRIEEVHVRDRQKQPSRWMCSRDILGDVRLDRQGRPTPGVQG